VYFIETHKTLLSLKFFYLTVKATLSGSWVLDSGFQYRVH